MSNPSFDNIDKWLFEFTEGNLSSHQEDQLKQFLLQNPDLEKDLDAWANAKVEVEQVVLPNLDSYTKKPIARVLPFTIVATLVASAGVGWMALNHINDSIGVESVARKSEIAYVRKTNETSSESNRIVKTKSSTEFVSTLVNTSTKEFLRLASSPVISKKVGTNYTSDNFVSEKVEKEIHSSRIVAVLENLNEKYSIGLALAKQEKEKLFNEVTAQVSQDEMFTENEQSQALAKIDKATIRSNERISSNYNKSFGSKVKSSIRKIIRMTENPIALINSKDIYYHTPGKQTLDVNFGSVGSLLTPRIQTVSRAQWTGHSNQQFANHISFDTYVKEIRGGIGVQVNHVYYGNGAYQVGQFALMYSPKFTVSKNVVIEPAIRFKMGNKIVHNQKMVPGQLVELDRQNEQVYENESVNALTQNLWYKDVGFALMSNTKWFSAGIQIDNLGRHYSDVFNSSDKNDYASQHVTATIGTDYVSRTKLFSLSPYIMYQKVENLSEIWGGSIFRYKKLTFGGGISSLGDYAGSIGIKTNRLMITYAVDNTASVLANKRLFSQQLTLRILTNRGSSNHKMLK